MQERLEPLAVGGGQSRLDALGTRRLRRYTRQTVGIKGKENIAHGLYSTPCQLGNGLREKPRALARIICARRTRNALEPRRLAFPLRTLLLGQDTNI